MTVIGKYVPPLTVASLAMTTTSRPETRPIAGDDPGARRRAVVEVVRRERRELEERRAAVQQALDALARQQLAARDVAVGGALPAARACGGELRVQVVDERAVRGLVGGEGLAAPAGVRREDGAHAATPSEQLAAADAVARRDREPLHRPGGGRDDLELHLHRLQHDEHVARADAVAVAHAHGEDAAGHRRLERGAARAGIARRRGALLAKGPGAAVDADAGQVAVGGAGPHAAPAVDLDGDAVRVRARARAAVAAAADAHERPVDDELDGVGAALGRHPPALRRDPVDPPAAQPLPRIVARVVRVRARTATRAASSSSSRAASRAGRRATRPVSSVPARTSGSASSRRRKAVFIGGPRIASSPSARSRRCSACSRVGACAMTLHSSES